MNYLELETSKTILPKTFEEIYSESYPMIYRAAFSILKNEYDTLDAIQNIYIKMLVKSDTLHDETKIKSWIMSITYNECRNILKSKKRESIRINASNDISDIEEFTACEDINLNPINLVDEQELKDEVLALVHELTDVQQEVIIMYYYNQKSVDEIAKAMNCSTGTVKSRLNNARKKLKKLINEYETRNCVQLHSCFIAMIFADIEKYKAFVIKSMAVGVSAVAVISGCVVLSNGNLKQNYINKATPTPPQYAVLADKTISTQPEYVVFADDTTTETTTAYTETADCVSKNNKEYTINPSTEESNSLSMKETFDNRYDDTDVSQKNIHYSETDISEIVNESNSITSQDTQIHNPPLDEDKPDYNMDNAAKGNDYTESRNGSGEYSDSYNHNENLH